MDSQRNILLISLALVSFLLFQQWSASKNTIHKATEQRELSSDTTSQSSVASQSTLAGELLPSTDVIKVTTDVLTLLISTFGGDVVEANLNKYSAELNSSEKFTLLKNTPDHKFIAQSGLIGPQGIDLSSSNRPHYQTSKRNFILADGEDEIRVPLSYQKDGLRYTKTFILKRNQYAIDVEFDVVNNSDYNSTVGIYAHLRQNLMDSGGSITLPTYLGGAYSTQDTRYKKYSFKDMKKNNLSLNLPDGEGWIAMIQHYFAAAWIPRFEANANLYTRVINNIADIGIRIPSKTIASGKTEKFMLTLWVGPKLQKEMEAIAKNLDLVVDYGWLWFIAKPLHTLLSFIQSFVGNWGIAIIILTFIVRGAMYSLTKAQYTSMAKMRVLQPKLQAMRERLGNDRQRMSQEMMELYKREKVNPIGGCLPIILQMPIFISLYWALMESVELRHSPFFAWIRDLSSQDPYFILPILMGASMFLIQKMSPTTITDPMQKKIMTFMPIVFTFFFLWFPSGLVLYWLVSNIVTLIQQTLIYKTLYKEGITL
ncbi:inner membrane protein oxaA [Candidatus Photodesmus blepharus]|uniref:Membrane protein insertase YidC n=1 Tax=Candidatus Photodesmus blepharonis TaxID=1179155 RepID=A0A084CNP6_9GAMM|nr:membrane protein insertase YidC [Candidatus Photodesmus blepharus]KEY91425.1 inner membrane protein oxaA [Candidatus Photodesmus blepharus]